jgi:hypothetical protein
MPHKRTLDAFTRRTFDASDGYRTRYPPFPEELPTNWFKHHTFSHPSSNNTRFGASPTNVKSQQLRKHNPYQGVPREDRVFWRNLPSHKRHTEDKSPVD